MPAPLTDKPAELSIEVQPATRLAIERAAAERGLSVPEFLQDALWSYLADAGYLKSRPPTPH